MAKVSPDTPKGPLTRRPDLLLRVLRNNRGGALLRRSSPNRGVTTRSPPDHCPKLLAEENPGSLRLIGGPLTTSDNVSVKVESTRLPAAGSDPSTEDSFAHIRRRCGLGAIELLVRHPIDPLLADLRWCSRIWSADRG